MLKTILSISGKPGLFKLISQAKNMLIVESLQTGKRQPAYAHEKIISLGDIAIFTDEEDVPLSEVLNLSRDFDWLAGLFFCLILKIFSLLLIYLSEYKKIDKLV